MTAQSDEYLAGPRVVDGPVGHQASPVRTEGDAGEGRVTAVPSLRCFVAADDSSVGQVPDPQLGLVTIHDIVVAGAGGEPPAVRAEGNAKNPDGLGFEHPEEPAALRVP